jgi:transcriptional regulator with XRE-family HTH domain
VARARRPKKRKTGYRPNESTVLREAGKKIAAVREGLGLTQEEAADRAGIDYKRWQRLESGSVNPTLRTLLRVAEALETNLWAMLDGRGQARR